MEASSALEVELIPSDREYVQVLAPANAEPYVVVKKEKKTLHIGIKEGVSFRFSDRDNDDCLKVIVYFKDLNTIKGAGAVELDLKGAYDAQGKNMSILLSGASSFEGSLSNVSKMTMDLSGASEADLKGVCDDLKLQASGASEADLEGFSAKNFSGTLSGASKADLTVTKTFSATVSGASKMEVKGYPKVLKAEKSGVSSIRFE